MFFRLFYQGTYLIAPNFILLIIIYRLVPVNYLKSHFWRENVNILPFFTQCYNGRHYLTLLNL